MTLKQIRKSKYPKASDFLAVLQREYNLKYTPAEWSMFETGRALPNLYDVTTAILRCLECDVNEIEEFAAYHTENALQGKFEPVEAMQDRFDKVVSENQWKFSGLPPGNHRKAVRLKPDVEKQVDEYLQGFNMNFGQWFRKYGIEHLERDYLLKNIF